MRGLARAVLASTVASGCTASHRGTIDEVGDDEGGTYEGESSDGSRQSGSAPPLGGDARPQQRAADAGSAGEGGAIEPSMLPIDAGAESAQPHDAGHPTSAWKSACDALASHSLADLKPVRAVEFLGLYWVTSSDHFGGSDPAVPPRAFVTEIHTYGERCASSESEAACKMRHDEATKPPEECSTRCSMQFVATRNGSEEQRLDQAGLRALLGSADSEVEAALLARAAGHYVACKPFGNEAVVMGTEIRTTTLGYELRTVYEECGDGVYRDLLQVAHTGTVTLAEHVKIQPSSCVIGRRPSGLRDAVKQRATGALGLFLADIARLEAASVIAFEQLVHELERLAAPRALIEGALHAMADEVRHARVMGKLARRFGARLERPEVKAPGVRTPFELALENAVEGCARETFGALVATYQAESARDPEVRTVMCQIAEDETRHAAWSWQLAHWLEPQLAPAQRLAVSDARARTLSSLHDELDFGLSRDEHALLGLPSPAAAAELLRGMTRALTPSC